MKTPALPGARAFAAQKRLLPWLLAALHPDQRLDGGSLRHAPRVFSCDR
jgi:hypothetical protein